MSGFLLRIQQLITHNRCDKKYDTRDDVKHNAHAEENNEFRQRSFMRIAIIILSIIFVLNQSSCVYAEDESDVTAQPTYTTFLPFATSVSTVTDPVTSTDPSPVIPVSPAVELPLNLGLTNPCPENQFRDLSTNACHPLDRTDYGFSVSAFLLATNTENVVQSSCTESSLQEALKQVSAGGIVQLPACTFSIGRVDVPSNVIIQGQGTGQTTINGIGCSETDSAKTIFNVSGRSNLIFRDMTLDAAGQNCVMLSVENSDNVLVERIKLQNSERTGMKFRRGVNNITIRYSDILENGEFHGIDSKDCQTGANLSKCPRDLWSTKYAVYSNVLRGHSTHGLNIHAIQGEIAGNLSYSNGYGGKLYDGQCLWVHHNLISNNANWGLFIAPTLDIDERITRDLYFYKNTFSGFQDSDSFAWGITAEGGDVVHPASQITNIYLMDNTYDGRIKTDNVAVNICPATTEWDLSIDNAKQGNDAICRFANYASSGGTTTFIQPVVNARCQ